MRRWYKLLLGILVVLVIVLAGFVIWAETPPSPMLEAYNALKSDSLVKVSVDNWLVFAPVSSNVSTGFIIYPGGRVDFRSYAPLAHAIAAEGYFVVIPHMPLNLAVFGSGRASSVIQAYPDIEKWVIRGHSLGGSMAALYAYNHTDQIDGLVLWASYPANSNDLSNSTIVTISISASLDGHSTPEKIAASHPLLPQDTTWVQIEGGNHAQLGWYGDQPGDNPATISREEQQAQIVKSTLDLLNSVSSSPW